jgi:hypothetical protein
MPSRSAGLHIPTVLLLLWVFMCSVLFFIDYEFPTFLQPFFTLPLLPSEDVT